MWVCRGCAYPCVYVCVCRYFRLLLFVMFTPRLCWKINNNNSEHKNLSWWFIDVHVGVAVSIDSGGMRRAKLCAPANVLIKLVSTHLSDADRTHATSADTMHLHLTQMQKKKQANAAAIVTRLQAGARQWKTRDDHPGGPNRQAQPCFTVNGLSIFAAGSYGS